MWFFLKDHVEFLWSSILAREMCIGEFKKNVRGVVNWRWNGRFYLLSWDVVIICFLTGLILMSPFKNVHLYVHPYVWIKVMICRVRSNNKLHLPHAHGSLDAGINLRVVRVKSFPAALTRAQNLKVWFGPHGPQRSPNIQSPFTVFF